MIVARGEMYRDTRARIDSLEREQNRLAARAKQRQPMDLCQNQVGRYERYALLDCRAERAVCRGVMLIAQAAQGDPRAAIDEQAGAGGCGMWRTARQRMSR